jgi:HSP20 family molecular chaperone IbpA
MNTGVVHIEKKEKEMIVQLKLPGYSHKDIQVEVAQGTLSILAAHKPGSLIKSIALPENTKTEKIRATLHDNTLTVFIPLRSIDEMAIHLWHKRHSISVE